MVVVVMMMLLATNAIITIITTIIIVIIVTAMSCMHETHLFVSLLLFTALMQPRLSFSSV